MRQQHTLQPKLRFPEFEGDWVSFSFKEIFNFTTGKNIKQKEASPNFETPCVRYGELYYMYKEVISTIINYTDIDKSELKFSEGDEILLPSAGEDPMDIGSASALIIKDVAIGRTINILKPKSKDVYSSIFASYYINQKLKVKISSLAKGVSISNVYNTDLQTLFIKLPTLPEQQKIADYLSTIDIKINLLEEKKEQLSRYKKAMMQKLFSQEIRFKDENGNDFGEWEEKKIGEIFEFKQGVQCEIEQQYLNRKEGQYRFVRIIDLTNSSEKPRYIYHNNIKDVISKNELFMVRYGTPGLIGYGYEGVIANNLFRLIPKIKLETKFYKYYLEYLRLEILSLSSSTSMPAISFKSLNFLSLFYLSILEQQKIAGFLSAIDESIEKVNEQIMQTQSFKKAMLQQMFV